MRDRNGTANRIVACVCGLLLWTAWVRAAPGLPPDPNNAALLYYQAMLTCPLPDDATSALLHKVLGGAEPNDNVKRYVSECRYAFRLAEAAVKIPECDWGIAYSLGSQLPVGLWTGQRRLAIALSAEAHMHASAGDYRTALTRCLLMQHIASHGGQYGLSVEGVAYRTTEHVLGKMPLDAQILAWLRSELASTPLTLPDLVQIVRTEVEMTLQSARTNDKTLAWLRDELLKHANESDRPRLASMTDDEVIDLARVPCTEFLDQAGRILDKHLPYKQTYAELQSLLKRVEEQAESNPAIFLSLRSDLEQTLRYYSTRIRRQAVLNAFQIAMEIYIETAKTGRLPRRLPPHQPLDPLTNQEYDYEITKTGFILRSRPGDIPDGGIVREFAASDSNALRQPEPWEEPARTSQRDAAGQSEVATEVKVEPTESARPQYKGVNDLEAIAQDPDVPAQVRERAQAARDRLRTRRAQGLRTPEPILIRASLCRVARDGGISLNIVAVDQDLDEAGLRIKEAITTPDGQIMSLTENYPIYIRAGGPNFEMAPLFPVTIREKGQRRDDDAWEAYLIDSYDWLSQKRSDPKADQRRYGLAPPTVWISEPKPDRVRVFVCLYDRQRHESDYVELENLLDQEPVDPFTFMRMFQSWLEEHSKQ